MFIKNVLSLNMIRRLLVLIFFSYSLHCALVTSEPVFEVITSNKLVVCYVRSWAIYRKSFAFNVNNINATYCSHLVYLFAGLHSNSADEIVSKVPHIDLLDNGGNGMYTKMTGLKIKHPHLKVLLSVGPEGSRFTRLAKNNKKRKTFARNAVSFLRKYNFDGLDLSWSYPTFNGGSDEDKANFPLLLEEIRKEFIKNDLLLTVVLSGLKEHLENSYDIPRIADQVDYMSVNIYNYNTPWENNFGIHAPLHSKDDKNVNFTVDWILKNGAPREKLVLRISGHGFGYTNVDQPGNVGAIKGLFNDDKGFLAVFETCEHLDSGWISSWDELSSTPVATKGNNKISYDDPRSIKIKAKLVMEKNLLGAGLTSLDTDDFAGVCSFSPSEDGDTSTKYPLLRAIKSALKFSERKVINGVIIPKIIASVIVHEF